MGSEGIDQIMANLFRQFVIFGICSVTILKYLIESFEYEQAI